MADAPHRVGWGFVSLYALSFTSTCLVLIAPLLVTLSLKVNSLVGIDRAPNSLALVTGIGALAAMVGNPFFGRMSDRTTSRLGMRRPWMIIGLVGGTLGVLVVAVAPTIPVVLAGWCVAQIFFNALLAAHVAVLPDQVPTTQRGVGLGRPRRVPPHRLGGRHLRGSAVHRRPARDVPGALRDRGVLHPGLRRDVEGPPPGGARASRPGRGASSPARSTSTPARARTSPGRSPAGSCSCWPTPS